MRLDQLFSELLGDPYFWSQCGVTDKCSWPNYFFSTDDGNLKSGPHAYLPNPEYSLDSLLLYIQPATFSLQVRVFMALEAANTGTTQKNTEELITVPPET